MSYAYDGNDKRVKSVNAVTNQTTFFVYDADGDLAAEYTINVPPPANPTISYLTEDALGSVRVVTDSAGDISQMKFGKWETAKFNERLKSLCQFQKNIMTNLSHRKFHAFEFADVKDNHSNAKLRYWLFPK